MTLFGYTLQYLRSREKLSLPALSEALGIGKTTLANIESGYIVPENEVAKKIADFFGVTVSYMRGSAEVSLMPDGNRDPEAHVPQRFVRLRPVTVQFLESGTEMRQSPEAREIILPLPASDHSDYIAVQVTDNSMARYRAMAGDFLVVRQDPLKIRNGDLVLLLSGEGHAILRRYFRKDDDVVLRSDNDDLLPPVYLSDCDKSCQLIGSVQQIWFNTDAAFVERRAQNPPQMPAEILPPPDMEKQEGAGGMADYMHKYVFEKKEKNL